jgi:hypothetical protein
MLRNARQDLEFGLEKPEGRRQFGGPRRRRMENIKMDLNERGKEGMD